VCAASRQAPEIGVCVSLGRRIRRITLPQSATIALLPWGNLLIILLKSTALVSLITLQELTFKAYTLNVQTFRTWELFGLALILYFVMAQMIAVGIAALYRRLSRGVARGNA